MASTIVLKKDTCGNYWVSIFFSIINKCFATESKMHYEWSKDAPAKVDSERQQCVAAHKRKLCLGRHLSSFQSKFFLPPLTTASRQSFRCGQISLV